MCIADCARSGRRAPARRRHDLRLMEAQKSGPCSVVAGRRLGRLPMRKCPPAAAARNDMARRRRRARPTAAPVDVVEPRSVIPARGFSGAAPCRPRAVIEHARAALRVVAGHHERAPAASACSWFSFRRLRSKISSILPVSLFPACDVRDASWRRTALTSRSAERPCSRHSADLSTKPIRIIGGRARTRWRASSASICRRPGAARCRRGPHGRVARWPPIRSRVPIRTAIRPVATPSYTLNTVRRPRPMTRCGTSLRWG